MSLFIFFESKNNSRGVHETLYFPTLYRYDGLTNLSCKQSSSTLWDDMHMYYIVYSARQKIFDHILSSKKLGFVGAMPSVK